MTELVLVSARPGSLKPLIEAALANELRILEAGMRRTKRRLRDFEKTYQMPTTEFLRLFEGMVHESVDTFLVTRSLLA